MFWRTIFIIVLLFVVSSCATGQGLVAPATTSVEFEVATPAVVAVSEESPSTPQAQVERYLLTLMEVLGDVERAATAEDFSNVATQGFSEQIAEDFNAQKAQGYGYEDLDGVEIWFSPIQYPLFLGDIEDNPELLNDLEITIVGCFIDNGVQLGQDPLTAEPSVPTKTFVEARLVERTPTWKIVDFEWSTKEVASSSWCLA